MWAGPSVVGYDSVFPYDIPADRSRAVGVDLPTVCRMGFSCVDEEFHVLFVLVVNLVHASDLSAEGESSVAAEGQGNRAITLEAGKVDELIRAHPL